MVMNAGIFLHCLIGEALASAAAGGALQRVAPRSGWRCSCLRAVPSRAGAHSRITLLAPGSRQSSMLRRLCGCNAAASLPRHLLPAPCAAPAAYQINANVWCSLLLHMAVPK